ncbi:hypothetical protein FLA105534_02360 [Flavobacterium bizetiae]|uniref:Uncharacterized protein n=1 Tax=Flavobacterium bizetiae TaxID=2704140 RepID=A0A6J4GIK1_9FLAO|nr:hypothetical protein FLA105534_02360 [Flavobacterium bizetiae]CAD5347114.1 hypothetical protein FLA105534_01067 [Flavobacterium bizetiae]
MSIFIPVFLCDFFLPLPITFGSGVIKHMRKNATDYTIKMINFCAKKIATNFTNFREFFNLLNLRELFTL